MASDAAWRRRRFVAAAALLGMFVLAWSGLAPAQKPSIYTCVVNGKRITSDRPIAECSNRDQFELNSDGSRKQVVPPTPTAEERAELEERQRAADAALAARNDAVRRDRNLVNRFPNEGKHREAREKALDDIRISVRNSEARVALLQKEKKPLLDEAEFYVGKPLPLQLKLRMDANDASMKAQEALIGNQQTEVGRINALYDAELARLKKLWAGAPLGSLPPASPVVPVAVAPATPSPNAPKNPTR